MEKLPALPPHDPIDSMILQALDKNVSVETLEKLLAMRKEYMAEQAMNAFNQAMTDFQNECPIIKKTKGVTTNTGVLAYRYAPLDSIVSQVRGLIFKHGFSYHISTEVVGSNVIVYCTVNHIQGHSKVTPYGPVPLGQQTAIMNDTQVVAAAFTYAKRNAFCNAFGIMTGETDTDGRHVTVLMSQDEIEELTVLLEEANIKDGIIFKRYKVKSLEEMTAEQGQDAIHRARSYIERLKGSKNE